MPPYFGSAAPIASPAGLSRRYRPTTWVRFESGTGSRDGHSSASKAPTRCQLSDGRRQAGPRAGGRREPVSDLAGDRLSRPSRGRAAVDWARRRRCGACVGCRCGTTCSATCSRWRRCQAWRCWTWGQPGSRPAAAGRAGAAAEAADRREPPGEAASAGGTAGTHGSRSGRHGRRGPVAACGRDAVTTSRPALSVSPAAEGTDAWSVCVVLYETVSGRHPFAGVRRGARRGPPEPPIQVFCSKAVRVSFPSRQHYMDACRIVSQQCAIPSRPPGQRAGSGRHPRGSGPGRLGYPN